MPDLQLPATTGDVIDLGEIGADGTAVLFVYPRTGKPGEPLPPGWDDIPGARGCTPQSCSFRDHVEELRAYGTGVIGISAQEPDDQREFAEREHIPYPLLSDSSLELADAMGLPVFVVAGMRLYRRFTFIARGGSVEKGFYPLFPPGRDVGGGLALLPGAAAGG